ncbi:cupin domain-containing protein [Methylophaga sp. OBS3]|uniref:cupin domain-containing protein n=1 Tax=Methylophaga sp. OBS3 TaxID=2991934 RepID=UPI00225BFD0E|nr:cupin domain-containing protein [Methylophaga sp. OBS3]MCX4189010.1 cupin domain-containing protein [Methylophaga sp. OBS3]
MKQIIVESNPSEAKLKKLGVKHWPTWQKEVSIFPWHFVTTEYAYILEGECVMTPEDGSPAVSFKAGDLVIFPNGFKGTWEVTKNFKKHFKHADGKFIKCFLCRVKILVNRVKSIFG